MFRFRPLPLGPRVPSPHARGDVPSAKIAKSGLTCFSPRPWGCSGGRFPPPPPLPLLPTPVGMFRARRRSSRSGATSPHARGDVPTFYNCPTVRKSFSPRPWGCSALREKPAPSNWLLPTPVGMFRGTDYLQPTAAASPHARGDVPLSASRTTSGTSFSPRPWGCSVFGSYPSLRRFLLPTPVGMFRALACRIGPREPSPHARGDVPITQRWVSVNRGFSPRPWGYSGALHARRGARLLLPTPVGMFRSSARGNPAARASPHARGDVPDCPVSFGAAILFSPRPWGCSGVSPAVVFRARASPHARGDVPTLSI